MELSLNSTIPIWGVITVLGAIAIYILNMNTKIAIFGQRLDAFEKQVEKLLDKIDDISHDVKEIDKKVK
jgi:cytoplasmic iron level regulating protein YaaA (DUF328/UPF0246 family)